MRAQPKHKFKKKKKKKIGKFPKFGSVLQFNRVVNELVFEHVVATSRRRVSHRNQ